MYNPKSRRADEFINREEIEATLKWAEEHKSDRPLIESLIDKARTAKGLTHREAAVLLFCDLEDCNERIFSIAREVKEKIYGNRIVLFAPLYLSNHCVNTCTYCPYPFRTSVTSVCCSRLASTPSTTPSNTFWSRLRPSIRSNTRTDKSAA